MGTRGALRHRMVFGARIGQSAQSRSDGRRASVGHRGPRLRSRTSAASEPLMVEMILPET